MVVSPNLIRCISAAVWFVSSSFPICYKTPQCECNKRIHVWDMLKLMDDAIDRFKRVGPNAMKGRGIGTARGRATIMRGKFSIFYSSPDPGCNAPVYPTISVFCTILSYYLVQLCLSVLSNSSMMFDVSLLTTLFFYLSRSS